LLLSPAVHIFAVRLATKASVIASLVEAPWPTPARCPLEAPVMKTNAAMA